MRKLVYILAVIVLLGCDSKNAWDCIQDAGQIINQEYDVEDFKKIQVWERVQLIIRQGEFQSVIVQTGENLIDEVQVVVEDGILKLSDRNSCNHVRDYGITKVFVQVPDLLEIRNSSGLTVESQGVIAFEELALISEDPDNLDIYHFDGDFRITLDVGRLKVVSNGISKFYLDGEAGFANFQLYDGDARIESADLVVQNLYFLHRSSNKMIVNPQATIRGELRGTGDVISMNRPPIVEVEELYTGRLIFQ